MKSVRKEYSNGEITIVWQNALCIHCGNCIGGLPTVFDTSANPWINASGASTTEMMLQVKKCPSGALSFYMNNKENLPKEQ